MRHKVFQFWAKLDTNHSFTLKVDFFLKKGLMLVLSASCTPSQYYNVKKNHKVDHKLQSCIIFGQIGLVSVVVVVVVVVAFERGRIDFCQSIVPHDTKTIKLKNPCR